MSVEEIPSDINILMTAHLHRVFNAGGCDPMCHACKKLLPVDTEFKLATITPSVAAPSYKYGPGEPKRVLETLKSREVMLCGTCNAEDFNRASLEGAKKGVEEAGNHHYGCFRVDGKIVTS